MHIDVVGGGAIGLLTGARLAGAGIGATVWTRTERQRDRLNAEGIALFGQGAAAAERIKVRSEWIAQADKEAAQGEWIAQADKEAAQGERIAQADEEARHGARMTQADEGALQSARTEQAGGGLLRGAQSAQASGGEEPQTTGRADGDGFRWILLAVKQGDIGPELLRQLRTLAQAGGNGTAVVCMQNGIGHIAKLAASLGNVPIFAAVTTEGARREGEIAVRHTGEGELWIGEEPENGNGFGAACKKAQKMLLSALRTAGFAVFLSNDIKGRVYRKLLVNAVINPLTAIFDVPNGELPQHPIRLELMRKLHLETEAVLLRAGMSVRQESWEALLEVCRRTAFNISSMLADVRAGRRTEVGEINGAVVALAEELGLRAPLNAAAAAMVAACGPDAG